jgi:hypothetical protein
MKALLLFLLPLYCYSQGGNTCSQALANPLPIGAVITTNTCNQGNDFSTTSPCHSSNPINALDYLYVVNPTSNGMLTINLTNMLISGIFSGYVMYGSITVYQSCPSLGNCLTSNFVVLSGTVIPNSVSVSFEATAGISYFILIDGWRVNTLWADCYTYTISSSLTPIPTNNGCANTSFNNGLTGWYGSQGLAVNNTVGQQTPLYLPINGSIGPPRITVANSFTDLCLPFTVVSPLGGNFVKLGRNVINREANRISYRFTVTPGSTSFTYAFLPVLQDPVHVPHNQPFFEAVLILQNGTILPCSRYIVAASQGLSGYINSNLCGNPVAIYRPWSLVNLDLSDYLGTTVTIQFTSGGCSQSAHWGYTYIDYVCSQSQIFNPNYSICEGECVTLIPPPNYMNYVWMNGGPTVCPTVNTIYNLQTTSQNGCLRTFQIPVNINTEPDVLIVPN